MELVLVETFKEDTLKAELYIEKELMRETYYSNYDSKDLLPKVCIDSVSSDIEYGISLINSTNYNLYQKYSRTLEKTKKITLDSLSTNKLKSILKKLAEENFENEIFLQDIKIVIDDSIV